MVRGLLSKCCWIWQVRVCSVPLPAFMDLALQILKTLKLAMYQQLAYMDRELGVGCTS
jgi:hypothetical protein